MLGRLFKSRILRNAPPPALRSRLRVEALEARDVPTANHWLGFTDDFTDETNWSLGYTPDVGHDLYFSGAVSHTDTTFVYNPAPPPSPPPPGPGPGPHPGEESGGPYFGNEYLGLHLVDGYTGTVTLPFGITFGTYEQSDGATWGMSITVQTEFTWSGGTVNSGPAGYLNLRPGATGLIAPTDEEAVDTGSTFTLLAADENENGAQLEINPGTVNLNLGKGFIVQKKGQLRFNAPVPTTKTVITIDKKPTNPDENGVVRVDAESECKVQTVRRDAGTGNLSVEFKGDDPYMLNRGNVEIKNLASLKFLKKAGALGLDAGYVHPEELISPVTTIDSGCSIICTDKAAVKIYSGTFEIHERRGSDGVPDATQPDILVKVADDVLTGLLIANTASLKRGGGAKVPLTLDIQGGDTSLMWDGTVRLYAKRGVAENDKIKVTGKVEVTNNAKLQFNWMDLAALRQPPATWTLIESIYDKAGDAINMAPPFDPADLPILTGVEALTPKLTGTKNRNLVVERTS